MPGPAQWIGKCVTPWQRLKRMKKQVYQSPMTELGEYDANRLMGESFQRLDFKEGVSAFVEGRQPNFKRNTV